MGKHGWIWMGLLLVASGCELPESGGENGGSAASGDPEWSAIQWQGQSYAGGTQVMTLSASTSGSHVHFNWNTWPFGGSMAVAHFFVWNGSAWQGGKFEWIRARGQSSKLLENIRHGYNGLRAPASGTAVAFAWTSADGSKRSNLAMTTWP